VGQVLDVPSQEVITKGNAVVTVDGVVFFQILDAAKVAYEITSLKHAILNLTMTNIRIVIRLLTVVDDATPPRASR